MLDDSPADDNGRFFDALDANDAEPDEETFPLPPGGSWFPNTPPEKGN